MNQDFEHLKLLSIVHYVYAAFSALLSCIPFILLFVGLSMLKRAPDAVNEPNLGLLGVLFIVIACTCILLGWAFAFCLASAGRYLREHRNYTFCKVIAALSCLCPPFGTVLGVFTIIVLSRPPVKALFSPTASEPAESGIA